MSDGTLVGKGYVEIEPDFSEFQRKVGTKLRDALAPSMRRVGDRAGRDLARGVDGPALGGLAATLKRRFGKAGDEAGRVLAAKVGKAARQAANDMFGLASAVEEVEKRSRRASNSTKRLGSDMFGVGKAAREAGKDLRFSQSEGAAWQRRADGMSKVSRNLSSRLRGLLSDFSGVSRGIRIGSGGFSGFDGVMSRVNRSAQFFRNIWRTIRWPVIVAGVGLTAQGLSALAAGAISAVSSLGTLSGVLVTLPSAALVAAQAFSVLKLATAGIGDTVKAALDAEVQSGTQAVDVLRQQEDAAERVVDAKRNLVLTERQATFAAEDLRRAHEEARRELEDLRFAADEADESIESSVLALRRAKQELSQTLADPAASGLDVREAELGVEQAENDLQRVRSEAKRAREDYRKAQDAGVKGMPQVVAAKQAEEDASRAVADAERDLKRAVKDNTAAMREQGATASALQEKMAQLPAAGQKFVRFLVALKPRLDDLRETAAEGFFPGAEEGLRGAMKNFKGVRAIIGGTAETIGRIAARAGKKIGSAEWGRDLLAIGDLNVRVLDRMGSSGLNLSEALRHVVISGRGFIDWLSASTLGLTDWIRQEAAAGRESGRLSGFFDRTRQTMERLKPILKGVGGGLLNVSGAADNLGNEILESLGDAAEGWRRWTDSTKGQNRLKRYFTETKPAIFEMGRLIRDAGKAFFELGRQRGVAHLLRLVRTGLIPAIRDLVGVTTGWASGFLRDFGRLRRQGTPAFDAFLQVLAEHAAEAGVRIAKALVNAFINSDVWGKLAIGGFLFAKFGGAFGRFGRNAGRRFASGFLLAVLGTELAKQIKTIIEGHELDAPKTEEFAKYLNDLFEIDTAKIVAPNRVKISTALGQILFNAQTEKVISVSSQKLSHLVGQIPAQFVTRFNEMRRLKEAFRGNLQPLPTIAGKTGADMRRAMFPKLDELADRGVAKARAFAKGAGGAFWSLTGTATKAMDTLGYNVRQMLRTLGGDPPEFNLKKALKEMPELPPMQQRQRGGFIVPGSGLGDTFKTMLPVGSFVENRKAVQRLPFQNGGMVPVALEPGERVHFPDRVRRIGADVLKARNEAVPRFGYQTGGIVSVPGFPGERMNSRILAPALAFIRRFNLFLTDAYGSGHESPEHTEYGTALDVAPGPGGSWSQVGQAVAYAVKKGWNPVYYDGSHGSISLAGHGPPSVAGDNAHAHVTLLTAAELLSGKLAGAVSGVVEKLRKPVIEGPAGALRQLGQLAVDKVHQASSRFLHREEGVVGGIHRHSPTGGLEATGNGAALMRSISANRGWSFADWWELDERETGHGADTYNESSGASLRAQFLPMNFGRYGPGSDPSQNPSMGEQIMSMAQYIAERYGNPTAALAHHDANNWYQGGGFVGLQKGGPLDGLFTRFAQKLAIGGGVNINRQFREAMYPSAAWSGLPELSFSVAAALAEAAGDWAGTDMPGVTMAQMSKGEGGLKPGSSGDDDGDGQPDGYGWLAITRPYGDEYGVQKFGGYKGMLNPVFNAAVAARMYGARGLAPWYGDSHVTDRNAHYAGSYDIRNSLGGQTFGEAVGQPKSGEGGPGKESVPASYRGARTGSLEFGPMPKTLEAADKEIGKWRAQAATYRKAKKHAEQHGKTATAEAIGRNLSKIEDRLRGLLNLRTQLRLKKAKEALGKRLRKAFGRFASYDQIIEGSQLAYERTSQNAEQIVALEPQPPELPADATDAQRAAADRAYVKQLETYVDNQERPAYAALLGRAADWRNNILRAETFGFGKGSPSVKASQNAWEGEISGVRQRIRKIKSFSAAVQERFAEFKRKHSGDPLPQWLKDQISDRNKMREELPVLSIRDKRLSGAVIKARELFFPGGKNRLEELPDGVPVQIPLPGTGTLEEKLREVQGIHWPEQHELLSAGEIGGTRVAGRFGGVIWELQETIEGLGLKLKQATNSLSTGGNREGDSELISILREIAERERKGRFVSERLSATLQGFDAFYDHMPKFHSGGVTPGPSTREYPALLKGHETVRTAEQEIALASSIQDIGRGGGPVVEVTTIIHGTIITDQEDPVETVIRDPRTKRVIQRTRGGRVTSGGARH